MTETKNEALLLERLGRIEAELNEIRKARVELQDLQHDISPLLKQSFQLILREMGQVESGFQLEDIFLLMRRFLRNIRNLADTLDLLENGMEAFHTAEPMLKSAMHHGIRQLGELEAKGVFRTFEAALEVRGKIASKYGPEDIAAMGDVFVVLIGLLKKLSDPKALALLEKLAAVPANVDLAQAKTPSLFGLVGSVTDPEVRAGLGVALELAKALGKAK